MAGHENIVFVNGSAPNGRTMSVADGQAYASFICGHCGERVNGAVIAKTLDLHPFVQWIRCTACGKGVVSNDGVMLPGQPAGEAVEGLPEDVRIAYVEARAAASVNAYTSSELMCRKILMHIAVDKGAEQGKPFAYYLSHLQENGFLAQSMIPWVDLIRQHGNIATHEIPATSPDRAMGTLAFTAQLLKLIYEMPYKVQQFMPSSVVES